MLGLDPFDMDFDGDVDGIDFLGFDYLMPCLLDRRRPEDADESAAARRSCADEEDSEDT